MNNRYAPPEQLRYATLLNWGARLGLGLLIINFLAYIFGLLPAHVPLDKLPGIWNQSVSEYLRQTGTPTGWHWLGMIGQGDFASLAGIALLCGCSLICLVAVIPIYASRRDKVFVVICVLAIAVQLLAASGILNVGH